MLKIVRKRGNGMIDNEIDRRVIRTRQIIHEALISLMMEKQYEKITVQDIIDRANVGRSTFYSHFDTKDELMKSSIEHMLELLNQHMSHVTEDNDKQRLIPVVEFFKHIQENSRLMKALVKGKSADLFIDKVQTFLNEKIEAYIYSRLSKEQEITVPLPILINYTSSTLIFLLKWWLDNKMQYTPEQMEQYFHELVIPSIRSVISKKYI
jgi:AcrR family transcriptional regulator